MGKSNPYRKPEDAWNRTENGIELKYPIFYHDPTIPNDPLIKKNIEYVSQYSREKRFIESFFEQS